MNKAALTLAAVCGLSGVSVWYSHKIKVDQRERMHAGVVRDLALEAQQKQLLEQQQQARDCESGVCDLKQTRMRDPKTGQVTEIR